MTGAARPPYGRLSAFYFFYFATLGAFLPYWNPYLKSIGFSPEQIGALAGIVLATKSVAPNLWAWIADSGGQAMRIVRLAAILAPAAFAGVFAGSSFGWLALVMFVFSFFWNAALPQVEAITLNHLDGREADYGRIRSWGSIGFIVTVWALGPIIDAQGAAAIRPALLVLLTGIALCSFFIPARGAVAHHDAPGSLLRAVAQPGVATFLLTGLLMQASHATYYTFFTIYLQELGYRNATVGGLWALGVAFEIGVFFLAPRLFGRFGVRRIFLASLATAALRWVLIALFARSLPVMLIAQAAHAMTFGAYHAAAMHLVHRYFRGRVQHRGQALYSSVSFGVGGALGSVSAGYLWTWLGAEAAFLGAAGLAVAAFLLALRGIQSHPGATAR